LTDPVEQLVVTPMEFVHDSVVGTTVEVPVSFKK